MGRMFWTDWDRYGPKIESANMDGTERMVIQNLWYNMDLLLKCNFQTLVNRGLGEPNSLAVDFFMYEVCWADAGNKVKGIKPRIGLSIINFIASIQYQNFQIVLGLMVLVGEPSLSLMN